jgi:hypothetical protein
MAAGAYGHHDPFSKNSTRLSATQSGAAAAADVEVVGCGDDAV